jgi:Tfp pilus assembly protein PilF
MRLLKEIRNLIGNYHVKSGVYHYYRNEYTQAIDFLRRALRDEDNLSDADRRNGRHYLTLSFVDLAIKLENAGQLQEAVDELQRASEVCPHFPDVHFKLARLLERLERLDDAVTEYRRALETHPEYVEAGVALGFCLLESGNSVAAADAFREALAYKVQRLQRPFDRGIELLDHGETVRAAEQFHGAFYSSPQRSETHLRQAMVFMKDEEFDRALVELDRALFLNPRYPDLHNYRGVVLCELERTAEAVDAFRVSAELSPGNLIPRLNLAFAFLRAGSHKEAEAELEYVLEQDPMEPAARAQLEELRAGRHPERRRPASRGSQR